MAGLQGTDVVCVCSSGSGRALLGSYSIVAIYYQGMSMPIIHRREIARRILASTLLLPLLAARVYPCGCSGGGASFALSRVNTRRFRAGPWGNPPPQRCNYWSRADCESRIVVECGLINGLAR